jgi:UDP:flavonoid glycosyltransferase YjiC (YdhE family)
MKKVLLIPSDHGGGRGHVSRCLYLAQKLKDAGYEPAAALERKHYREGLNGGLNTYLLDTRFERIVKYQLSRPFKPGVKLISRPPGYPVFVEFSGLEYQVPRDGYFSAKTARWRFRQLDKIFNSFKPDLLIGDTHYLTFLLGDKHMVPVIQITRQAGFPPAPEFLWWKEESPDLVKPDAFMPFYSLGAAAGMAETSTALDLLQGHRYLIPASKEIEPVNKKGAKVIFSGPLAEMREVENTQDPFSQKTEFPRIYITIGGGAGRSNEQALFSRILSIFDKSEFQVLVSTAGRIPAKAFENSSANVKFADWVDGAAAINHADLVIHHGGYGTAMETLLAAKPSIVIPSHSEQEGNGRRLQERGLGRIILPYKDELSPLQYWWTYGEYTMLAAYELFLDKEEIFSSINDLLYSGVHEKLKTVSASLKTLKKRFQPERIINFD